MKYLLLPVFFLLWESCFGQSNSKPAPPKVVEIMISSTPGAVVVGGKSRLCYELWIANASAASIFVNSVEVLSGTDSTVIASFDKEGLQERLHIAGKKSDGPKILLERGTHAIVYLEHDSPLNRKPKTLINRVSVSREERGRPLIAYSRDVVVEENVLTLGPPLSGGPWAAVYDPDWERGHRRVIYSVDGVERIPGRFAIDFIKLDEQGRFATGDDNVITNWFGYGEKVLAVADGIVASVRDDFSESRTIDTHPKHPAERATGNYVSIRISDNRYAFYEHLKPGSVRVKPGQRVKKGEWIASLGFTGQTTGPHLHFHLAGADSPLGAEGVPFVFEKFNTLGSYSDFSKFGAARWETNSTNAGDTRNEMPPSNHVIQFGQN